MKGLKSLGLHIKFSFVVENGNYWFSSGIMHSESYSDLGAHISTGCKCVCQQHWMQGEPGLGGRIQRRIQSREGGRAALHRKKIINALIWYASLIVWVDASDGGSVVSSLSAWGFSRYETQKSLPSHIFLGDFQFNRGSHTLPNRVDAKIS